MVAAAVSARGGERNAGKGVRHGSLCGLTWCKCLYVNSCASCIQYVCFHALRRRVWLVRWARRWRLVWWCV